MEVESLKVYWCKSCSQSSTKDTCTTCNKPAIEIGWRELSKESSN